MPAATEQDIRDCYRLLLGREADPVGLSVYTRAVQAGLPREKLVWEFVRSEEFRNLAGLNRPTVENTERDFTCIVRPPGLTDYDRIIGAELARRIPPSGVIVDIGSGAGYFALVASGAVGSEGIVVAIEPDPDRVGLLAQNVHRNERANVMILPCAAGTDLRPFHPDGTDGSDPPVPSVELDKAIRPPLDRLDLIRIGTGGLEFCALAAFETTLRRFRPTLVCHFNPRTISARLTEEAIAEYLVWLFDHSSMVELLKRDGSLSVLASPSDARTQCDAEFAANPANCNALVLIARNA